MSKQTHKDYISTNEIVHKVDPESQYKAKMRRYAISYCVLMSVLLLFGWRFEQSSHYRPIAESVWALNIREYSELISNLSERMGRRLDLDLLSNSGLIDAPELTPQSTFFEQRLNVVVRSAHNDHKIYFSTDGSVPTRRHERVKTPILVNETTILRVKAFDSQGRHSPTVSANYIDRQPANLEVVSLNIDPVHLYHKHVGIIANPFQRKLAWERPGQLVIQSQIDDDDLVEIDTSVRIHGSASRSNPRKSLRVYVDPDDSRLTSWFDSASTAKNALQPEWVFKHVGNNHQLFRDRLGRRLARQLNLVVGTEKSCLLYVNGEPWGVYDVHERINAQFLSRQIGGEHFAMRNGGIFQPNQKSNPPNFDNTKDWSAFYRSIEKSDIKDQTVYEEIEELIDISEFIDHMILAIYSADLDRPNWNMDMFREDQQDSKWRFLVWDFDGGFNYRGKSIEHDTIAWHLRDATMPNLKTVGAPDSLSKVKSTLVLRRLMENSKFRLLFKNRFEILLETILSPKQLNSTFDKLLTDYAAFEHIENLRLTDTPLKPQITSYDEQVAQIRDFLTRRTPYLRQTLERHLP